MLLWFRQAACIVCVMLLFRVVVCFVDLGVIICLFVVALVGVRYLRVVWFDVVWVLCYGDLFGFADFGLIVLVCVSCLLLVLLTGLFG